MVFFGKSFEGVYGFFGTLMERCSQHRLDLVSLRSGDWEMNMQSAIGLPQAHGAEIVRTVYVEDGVSWLCAMLPCGVLQLIFFAVECNLHRGGGWVGQSLEGELSAESTVWRAWGAHIWHSTVAIAAMKERRNGELERGNSKDPCVVQYRTVLSVHKQCNKIV